MTFTESDDPSSFTVLDTIEELEEKVQLSQVYSISIVASYKDEAEIEVSLNGLKSDTRVHAFNPDRELRGVLEEVKDLLRKRERRFFAFFYGTWRYVLVAIAFAYTLALSLKTGDHPSLKERILGPVPVVVILLLYAILMFLVRGKFSRISLCRSEDRQGFWKRNRDALIVGMLVTVLGGVAVVWLTPFI